MNKVLTLAIPVYNMEKYLSRCLDSVVTSTKIDDIEVLVINDGSKDNSLDIANKYGAEYPNSVIVIDKPNGGWGTVINMAMDKATGKYFKILDSDDWFNTAELDKLVEVLKDTDVDVVATAYTKIYDDKPAVKVRFEDGVCNRVLSYADRLKMTNYESDVPMASICYRTDILKSIGLEVAEKYYADVEYALIPLHEVKSILYLNLDVYQYYLGREDHSTSTRGYKAHSQDYVNMTKKLVQFYEKSDFSNSCRQLFDKEIIKHVRFCYYLYLSSTYLGGEKDSVKQLKLFNEFINKTSGHFFQEAAKAKVRGFIPYIKIWRATGINVLNIRKWI